MGIERTALGSLLDHTGPFGRGEKYQSYVFGSTRTYSGVNGSSGSNRVVFSACVQEDQVCVKCLWVRMCLVVSDMCIYTTKHTLLGISPTQTEQQPTI